MYREQAEDVFRQHLHDHPTDIPALNRLATVVTTYEERAEILRRVVASDPTDLAAVERLAAVLINIPGLASVRERIDIQEYVYANADLSGDTERLRLAVDLLLSYRALIDRLVDAPASSASAFGRVADVEARRADFVNRVREDSQIDAVRRDIDSAPASDAERTAVNLSLLCSADAVSVLGARDCIESLAVVVDAAVTSGGTEVGFLLADSAASTMRSLAGNDWRFRLKFPALPERFC